MVKKGNTLYRISKGTTVIDSVIALSSSKSISNRILLINHIGNLGLKINQLSDSADTEVLVKSLTEIDTSNEFNTGHAGTSFRFLTALLAATQGERVLTGSERMKQRPIAELVDCLRQLGADITYLENEGFPPLRIKGKKLNGGKLTVNGNISSQYISALLLISPLLAAPLELELTKTIVSRPYINMTVELMGLYGVKPEWRLNNIVCPNTPYTTITKDYTVEADWSSASYWYSIMALSSLDSVIQLKGLIKESLQADAVCIRLFNELGVSSQFKDDQTLVLTKNRKTIHHFSYDFSDCPDIAQTIAVVAAALGIEATLTGLNTLKIKETDRIQALHKELKKVGIQTEFTDTTLYILPHQQLIHTSSPIATYEDHRMAMSFTPLALKLGSINIMNPEVVRKSYPSFWKDLKTAGFTIDASSDA